MFKVVKRAWADTKNWVMGYKFWPYIIGVVFVLVCSLLTTLLTPINANRLTNGLYGLLGGIIALVLFILILFIVHLIITPPRQRKEEQINFIREHASYSMQLIGDPIKQKYLATLDTLQKMVNIENKIADKMYAKYKLTHSEIKYIKKELSQQLKMPARITYSSPELFVESINKVIKKSGLQISGEMPDENQILFMIKMRSALDDIGKGLKNGLENNDEYKKLLIKLYEQVPNIDDNTPGWICCYLALPSGINSTYLFWSYLPKIYKTTFFKLLPTSMPFLPIYKSELAFISARIKAIDQMADYANETINS
jgi:hypothetical protein